MTTGKAATARKIPEPRRRSWQESSKWATITYCALHHRLAPVAWPGGRNRIATRSIQERRWGRQPNGPGSPGCSVPLAPWTNAVGVADHSMSAAVAGRIGYAGSVESGPAQPARIAAAAGQALGVGLVARQGEAEIDPEFEPAPYDLGLAERDQWGRDLDPAALDSDLGGELREPLEGGDELGAAVGIARVIDRVDADIDLLRADHFGVAQGEREQHRVARGDVGRRDAAARRLGHGDLGGQGRAANGTQVDLDDAVFDRAERLRDPLRRRQFGAVALAVAHAERVAGESGRARLGQGDGRIHAARKQHDGFARIDRGHGAAIVGCAERCERAPCNGELPAGDVAPDQL